MNQHPVSGPPPGLPSEPLAVALKRAAAVLDAQSPPPGGAAALLAELRHRPQPGARAGRWLRLTAWSGGVAAFAMLALASTVLVLAPPPGAGALATPSGEFLPLAPREDWPDEAAPGWLVPTEITPEKLAALGLPYDPADTAASRRAELLVHASGRVLALRLVD